MAVSSDLTESKMKIAFRADASLQIGTGHVIRCLTLAEILRKKGCECYFVCRGHAGNIIDLIRKRGFITYELPAQVGEHDDCYPNEGDYETWLGVSWKEDAEQTIAVIGAIPVDWLIVDHYALDERWEALLRNSCAKIMVIDDLTEHVHDCDLLLNQNLILNAESRYKNKVPNSCGLLLGPTFALLQVQYAELHGRVPLRHGKIENILIYFGGADRENLTGMALSAFISLGRRDITVDVVINPLSPHVEAVRRQISNYKNIVLHERLPTLAHLMVKADISIGAGGSTSWERCCLGLPCLVVTLAENQKPIAEELCKRGFIELLGHKDEINETVLINALINALDRELFVASSEQCYKIVDGRGAERVASILMLNPRTQLHARPINVGDETLFLDWVGSDISCAVDVQDVDANVRKLFCDRLRDIENWKMYVVENTEGLSLGIVSFKRNSTFWDVNYHCNPLVRNRNLDRSMLRTAVLVLRNSVPGVLQFSSVKETDSPTWLGKLQLNSAFSGDLPEPLHIAVCSDFGSWINYTIPDLLFEWMSKGYDVAWSHSANELDGGDICFYMSYGRIVDSTNRRRYRNNLVIHASDLPKGRGWSPASWLILDGANRIPVTLLEAVDEVDAGPIYLQEWIDLDGTELIDDWRQLLAEKTISLARSFVSNYPAILDSRREQVGEASAYPRRRASDSRLDTRKTIEELFNQLRIVDNESYPAFFVYKGREYLLKIEKR